MLLRCVYKLGVLRAGILGFSQPEVLRTAEYLTVLTIDCISFGNS